MRFTIYVSLCECFGQQHTGKKEDNKKWNPIYHYKFNSILMHSKIANESFSSFVWLELISVLNIRNGYFVTPHKLHIYTILIKAKEWITSNLWPVDMHRFFTIFFLQIFIACGKRCAHERIERPKNRNQEKRLIQRICWICRIPIIRWMSNLTNNIFSLQTQTKSFCLLAIFHVVCWKHAISSLAFSGSKTSCGRVEWVTGTLIIRIYRHQKCPGQWTMGKNDENNNWIWKQLTGEKRG